MYNLLPRIQNFVNSKHAVKGAQILAMRIFGSAFSLINTILIVRSIPLKESGFYYLLFSVASVLTVIGALGLTNEALRKGAHYTAQKMIKEKQIMR